MNKNELPKHFTELVEELNNKYSFLKKDGFVLFTEKEKKYINKEFAYAQSAFKNNFLHPTLADSVERLSEATGLSQLAFELELKEKYEEALLEYIKSILIAFDAVYSNYFSIADILYKTDEKEKSLTFYKLYLQEAEKHLVEFKQRASQEDVDTINFINRKCEEARKKIDELSK